MSRSFKQYGIIKDKGMSRGEYNRVFRRVNRYLINQGKDPKHLYEVVNSWTICDYKIRWEIAKKSKYYRSLKCDSKQEYLNEKRRFFSK